MTIAIHTTNRTLFAETHATRRAFATRATRDCSGIATPVGDARPRMDERSEASLFESALAQSRAAFVAALNGGDAEGASSVYAADARLLPPAAEPMQGRAAIEAFWRAGVEAGMAEVDLHALELERRDDHAYEIGRYAFRLEPTGGAAVVDRGNYVLVYERQEDGSWRRAVEMFNPDGSPVVNGRPEEENRR